MTPVLAPTYYRVGVRGHSWRNNPGKYTSLTRVREKIPDCASEAPVKVNNRREISQASLSARHALRGKIKYYAANSSVTHVISKDV